MKKIWTGHSSMGAGTFPTCLEQTWGYLYLSKPEVFFTEAAGETWFHKIWNLKSKSHCITINYTVFQSDAEKLIV